MIETAETQEVTAWIRVAEEAWPQGKPLPDELHVLLMHDLDRVLAGRPRLTEPTITRHRLNAWRVEAVAACTTTAG